MYGNIPPEQDAIRQRLIQGWIAKERDVEGQVDGCEAIASAFWQVLALMMGSTATRAVFMRAAKLARKNYSPLDNLVVNKDGLDFAQLRDAFRQEDPANSRKTLVALVDEVFNVLHDLLGPTLTAFLREVERELERKASDLKEKEAQAKTKGAPEGSAGRTDEEKR